MKLEEFIQAVSDLLDDADIAAELEMGLELRMTIAAGGLSIVALRPENMASTSATDPPSPHSSADR